MERKNLALLCAGVVCFWLFALAFGTAQGSGLRRQKGVAVLPKAKNGKTFRLHGGDLNGSERHEISSPKQVDDHCTRAGVKLF